ncbi:MAG: peptide ABC transporter substrate-binding protein [Chloroflexi bacterium]|uniref:Peptide ABC transporter substrate-binding protein n=1 Tax=Candidatus Chlorohelix allophototropha TaxID=3003348 RepID=A0A8T7M3Q7_9CHLR|nr:peptide ABC transporter substrate-binding protein [Chloroflexota bacterium]WJW66076.1 peptide ABC transporter substrate-binding protein [Chloroflexota bacterium L227-S17]
MKDKRAALLLAGVLLLTTLLYACGDSPTATVTTTAAATTVAKTTAAATTATTTAATTTAAVTATTAAATTVANAKPAVFHWAKTGEPLTLDPAYVTLTDAIGSQLADNLFEGLLELNPQMKVIPASAEALPTVSADGKLYTFKLRKDLKFSNGDPLNATDFIYSWNRVARSGITAAAGSAFSLVDGFDTVWNQKDEATRTAMTVSGFKAVDDYTIEITLKKPGTYFLTQSTLPGFYPVNRKVIEANPAKVGEPNKSFMSAETVVSNGPFLIKDWKRDTTIRLEPNPYYSGNPKPSVSAVTIDVIKDATTSKLKYDNGELDEVGVPLADMQTAPKDPKYKDAYVQVPLARTTWLAFNMSGDNVFSRNLKLRQAFAYSLDLTLITQGALSGSAFSATSLLPKGFPGYHEMNNFAYNLDKAKQLFKDAGYDTPEKIKTLEQEINNWGNGGLGGGLVNSGDRNANKVMMENIQQQLKTAFGVELKVNLVATLKEFVQRRDQNHEFLLYRGNWEANYPDPQTFYESTFFSTSSGNSSGYKNPLYDELVTKANSASDSSQRYDLYYQAEQVLQNDVAYIPMYNAVEPRLIRPTIQNWGYNAQGPMKLKYMQIKPS